MYGYVCTYVCMYVRLTMYVLYVCTRRAAAPRRAAADTTAPHTYMVQLLLISTVLLGFIPPALQPRTVARLPVSQLIMFEGRQREPKEPPVDGETPETPQDSEAPAPPRDPPPSTAAKNMKLISDGIFVLFTIAIQTLGAASVLGVLPVNSDSASARSPRQTLIIILTSLLILRPQASYSTCRATDIAYQLSGASKSARSTRCAQDLRSGASRRTSWTESDCGVRDGSQVAT